MRRISAILSVVLLVLAVMVSASLAEGEQTPTPLTGQIFVAQQDFENGVMFWLQFTDQIWVLTVDHEGEPVWLVFENTFESGQSEIDPLIIPPEDLIQPKRGFGAIWRDNLIVRDLLGWAVGEEEGFLTTYTYISGGEFDDDGVYIPAPGLHELIGLDDERYRIDEATGAWEVVEPIE